MSRLYCATEGTLDHVGSNDGGAVEERCMTRLCVSVHSGACDVCLEEVCHEPKKAMGKDRVVVCI